MSKYTTEAVQCIKQISYVYSNGVHKYFSRAIFFLPKTFYTYILVQNQIYICEIETFKICSKEKKLIWKEIFWLVELANLPCYRKMTQLVDRRNHTYRGRPAVFALI